MKAATNLQNTLITTIDQVRNAIHPQIRMLACSTLFGILTAYSAYAALRLPFTPVPITGQVLVALLAGSLLGPKWGALSQLQYLAIGAAGAPVFAGGTSGLLPFIGPSGGYLFGFVAAAWLTGTLADRFHGKFGLLTAHFAGLATIYLFGWFWLSLWLGIFDEGYSVLLKAFALGIAPFIAVDTLKVVCATYIALMHKTLAKRLESRRNSP